MKYAVGKHNNGEDPLPYLLAVMIHYEGQMQWKILAQICSYTILFSKDLEIGVDYFMMLVEAEQNGFINSDLILVCIFMVKQQYCSVPTYSNRVII